MNYKTIRKNNLYLEIYHDEFSSNPRQEEYDNFGIMVCWHKRYDLGDKNTNQNMDPNEFIECLKENNYIYLPLYFYDHSGVTIKTSSFNCKWDSGQVGYIYVTDEKIKTCFKVDSINEEIRKKAIKTLELEVEIYDQYLRGEVYGFTLSKINEKKLDQFDIPFDNMTESQKRLFIEVIDSCSQYYGNDFVSNGLIDGLGEYGNIFKNDLIDLKLKVFDK